MLKDTNTYNELIEQIESNFGYAPYTDKDLIQIIYYILGYCKYPYKKNKTKYMYAMYEVLEIIFKIN